MAIVTISHEMGAGGSIIGAALAERLEYRYVDQDMLARAAREYGVLEDRLSRFDEIAPSLFDRFDAETRHYLSVLQSAVLDVAERDNVVIMGRGGQCLLRGIDHALRVFVRAPFELRVQRVVAHMAATMGETVDAATAAELVRRNDRHKVGRMRYLFDVEWRDPALYDLVVSTERLGYESVVEAILGLLRRPELAGSPASRQAVRDRALASRVRVALCAHPETRRYRIGVTAEQGVVRLEGTAAQEAAVQVAHAVPGVVDVRWEPLEVPPIPPFVA